MSLNPTDREYASSDDEAYKDARTADEIRNAEITERFKKFGVQLDDCNIPDDEKSNPDVDGAKFQDCCSEFVDEDELKEQQKDWTDEERKENKGKAENLKNEANDKFKTGEYQEALELYTTALKICPVENCDTERSILYSNRAAAKIKLDAKKSALRDCDIAIKYNPNYVRALIRRAKLYEDLDQLDESLADNKKICELDPSNHEARGALIRLPPLIAERNARLKAEVLDKLKDLGNMVLKPFGLSTDNFQMKQDPVSGSYSMNFTQNQ